MQSLSANLLDLERVLFVHAHPDDETITTGGTIALLVERGTRVTVLTCTRGELGEVIPTDLPGLEGNGDRLAEVRTLELAAAMAALGVTDHRFLGDSSARWVGLLPRRYTDSGMRWGATGAEPAETLAPDSFCAAEFGEVAADIAAVINAVQPGAVVSYDVDGGYGHPDHRLASAAARHAASVTGVPFWSVDEVGAASKLSVDVSSVLQHKTVALQAHRTQVVVEGERFRLSSGPARPIGAIESFSRIENVSHHIPAQSSPVPWRNQAPMIKAFAWMIAALGGAAIGAITVVNHQFAPDILGVTPPVGIVGALLIIACLLGGLRLVFTERLVAGSATLGLLLMIGLLSVKSGGGSILVPGNPAGYCLIVGSVVIVAVVLAWPKSGTFSRDKLASRPEPKGPFLP